MSVALGMNQNPILMFEAEVIDVNDPCGARRIRARAAFDKEDADIPWCLPLMPKVFNVVPKVGEVVLISCTRTDPHSNRFYMGPIISQFQNMAYEPYNHGIGNVDNLLSNTDQSAALENIEDYAVTEGAFPDVSKVAIVGRDTEDISLKDGRIQMRAGARVDVSNDYDALQGKCGFDRRDTSFIMLRKKDEGLALTSEKDTDVSKSVAVIGADKFLFASRKNNDADAAMNEFDPDTLIRDEDLQQLQDALHAVPYGDILVKCLNNLKQAMIQHVHPWAGLPPCNALGVDKVIADDYNKILSPNMHIS